MWTKPLKNRNSQTITEEFSSTLTTSKRKLLKIESDRGAEIYNIISQKFLRSKTIQQYSRFTDKGPSIAETIIKTVRILIKKHVFLAEKANWISELRSIMKQYINTIHPSIKMTPVQANEKVNEK